jgi:subtilase family serine protease
MSFDSVLDALADDVEDVTIIRKAAPTYVKGILTPAATTPTTIVAQMNVQPMGQQEAQELDKEFTRSKNYKKFYSSTQLQSDDVLSYCGLNYEILNLGNWIKHGGFCEAGCVSTVKL